MTHTHTHIHTHTFIKQWEDKSIGEVARLLGDGVQIILIPITIAIRMNEKFQSNDQAKYFAACCSV